MYNENVLKWFGSYYDEEYEDITDYYLNATVDDIIVYDDSLEWYNNIEESEADG